MFIMLSLGSHFGRAWTYILEIGRYLFLAGTGRLYGDLVPKLHISRATRVCGWISRGIGDRLYHRKKGGKGEGRRGGIRTFAACLNPN